MLFSNQWTEAQSLCHVVVTLLLFGSCLNPHRIAELLHAGRPVPASHEANLIMKAKCSRFTSHAGGTTKVRRLRLRRDLVCCVKQVSTPRSFLEKPTAGIKLQEAESCFPVRGLEDLSKSITLQR